jgi:UDP-2-acetamido-3-amino-2,3-dideoxy-glucuronate N-acetyltransferase
MQTHKIAVVGSGYWGKNLVRNFHQLGALAAVCDSNPETLAGAASKYGVPTFDSWQELLRQADIPAVVIAAPAARHFELCKAALLAGKDVYVEKPIALQVEEGEELVALAAREKRILMVGHILEYHPAIIELTRLVKSGELGRIQYIYSSRLNLGKVRTEENILWSFAPHDISVILSLLGEAPTRVAAHGGSYIDSRVVDTTLTTCEFASGVQAHVFVSWLHPFKEQKLTIVADRKMAVFNDIEPERKLMLYSHRIDWVDRAPVAHRDAGEVVPLPSIEPLRAECEHFLQCIDTRAKPRTDGASAVEVLRVLAACEQSLQEQGRPVSFSAASKPRFFAHPTAVIDSPCEIGDETKIWHFSHIMAGCTIGRGCNLGQNVVVSPGVSIGNNVKIQNNVSIYTGVELEDDVFCGPSMVFTNVVNPRSHVVRRNEYQKTTVQRGASLGANSTIVCGHTIGRYAFIAAGAVVTRDVPDYALMAGTPARRVGWMCNCGIRLHGTGDVSCAACRRHYRIDGDACVEITEAERPSRLSQISVK